MNGVGIRLPFATGDVGDVYEIGFVALTSTSGGSARVTGLCSYTSDNGVHGKPPLNILIHGDSTAEDFYFRVQLVHSAINGWSERPPFI